ncbi:membrane-anchored junction protein isoform X2 [Narcine bancroftii]|uniref:membrane-anchored junction protein isoform X2 n=1 Tax=Narcine bancroftii TaxID=1343680 RepID=UPI0038316AAF
MALKGFTYPLPETRFIHAGRMVYKLKMRYSQRIREDLGINRVQVGQELEESIRAVLGNLDNLQPFNTVHFTIFPYKNKWESLSELRFKQGSKVLITYPYVCTLYVELRLDQQHSNAVNEETPFTDCSRLRKLTREAAATATHRAMKKERERSQMQPSSKRVRNAIDVSNEENARCSDPASQKKWKGGVSSAPASAVTSPHSPKVRTLPKPMRHRGPRLRHLLAAAMLAHLYKQGQLSMKMSATTQVILNKVQQDQLKGSSQVGGAQRKRPCSDSSAEAAASSSGTSMKEQTNSHQQANAGSSETAGGILWLLTRALHTQRWGTVPSLTLGQESPLKPSSTPSTGGQVHL